MTDARPTSERAGNAPTVVGDMPTETVGSVNAATAPDCKGVGGTASAAACCTFGRDRLANINRLRSFLAGIRRRVRTIRLIVGLDGEL